MITIFWSSFGSYSSTFSQTSFMFLEYSVKALGSLCFIQKRYIKGVYMCAFFGIFDLEMNYKKVMKSFFSFLLKKINAEELKGISGTPCNIGLMVGSFSPSMACWGHQTHLWGAKSDSEVGSQLLKSFIFIDYLRYFKRKGFFKAQLFGYFWCYYFSPVWNLYLSVSLECSVDVMKTVFSISM